MSILGGQFISWYMEAKASILCQGLWYQILWREIKCLCISIYNYITGNLSLPVFCTSNLFVYSLQNEREREEISAEEQTSDHRDQRSPPVYNTTETPGKVRIPGASPQQVWPPSRRCVRMGWQHSHQGT